MKCAVDGPSLSEWHDKACVLHFSLMKNFSLVLMKNTKVPLGVFGLTEDPPHQPCCCCLV